MTWARARASRRIADAFGVSGSAPAQPAAGRARAPRLGVALSAMGGAARRARRSRSTDRARPGPEPMTLRSSPTTSEIASVTTRPRHAAASRPPLTADRCLRTVFSAVMSAPASIMVRRGALLRVQRQAVGRRRHQRRGAARQQHDEPAVGRRPRPRSRAPRGRPSTLPAVANGWPPVDPRGAPAQSPGRCGPMTTAARDRGQARRRRTRRPSPARPCPTATTCNGPAVASTSAARPASAAGTSTRRRHGGNGRGCCRRGIGAQAVEHRAQLMLRGSVQADSPVTTSNSFRRRATTTSASSACAERVDLGDDAAERGFDRLDGVFREVLALRVQAFLVLDELFPVEIDQGNRSGGDTARSLRKCGMGPLVLCIGCDCIRSVRRGVTNVSTGRRICGSQRQVASSPASAPTTGPEHHQHRSRVRSTTADAARPDRGPSPPARGPGRPPGPATPARPARRARRGRPAAPLPSRTARG